MSEITFRDAIRMVHPDTNKNITDAGEKVKTIMMFKNEPHKMYEFLKMWNLLPGQSYTKPKTKKRVTLSHLKRNTFYNGEVFIRHRKYSDVFQVSKTTDRRVYFTKDTRDNTGKSYCNIESVFSAYYYEEV